MSGSWLQDQQPNGGRRITETSFRDLPTYWLGPCGLFAVVFGPFFVFFWLLPYRAYCVSTTICLFVGAAAMSIDGIRFVRLGTRSAGMRYAFRTGFVMYGMMWLVLASAAGAYLVFLLILL